MLENPDGPGCLYCGKVLDMSKGKWVAARPHITHHYGFHLPQVIIPARTKIKKWTEIRNKVFGVSGEKGYSTQKTANEVFGLPSGVGGRILSLREAMACCNSSRREWTPGFPTDERNIIMTVLGVDWSVSGSTKSYTVVSILGYDYNGKAYLLYSQRMDGIDILDQVRRVEELFRKYKCSILGSDRGVGVLQGQLFQQHLGEDRVCMVQYVAAKNALRWDKVGGFYAADRTMSIDTIVLKAKIGPAKFETPSWELMSGFWEDALNVYEEESHTGRRLYRKDEDLTDDWLHSIVFANVAYMVANGEFVYVDDVKSDSAGFNYEDFIGNGS